MRTYYKVIVLQIDTFESSVADERHFGTIEEATRFSESATNDNHVGVIVKMGE